jgi:anti-sigma regulatory factor (Ser/Thr protein kinase)
VIDFLGRRFPVDRWSWTISIPGTPSMVPVARSFVRAFLGDHPHAEDAELIASEYVTNAVRHTASGEGGVIHVTVVAAPGAVRIEVTDYGPASDPESGPAPSPPQTGTRDGTWEEENGRGLLIVDCLASRWGHYRLADGQLTAWAELGEMGDPAGDGTVA